MAGVMAQSEITRGIAARDAGNHAAAVKAFETVISLDAEDPLGFLYLADMHLRAGRSKDAISVSRVGLSLPCSDQNRSFGLRILALAYIKLKNHKRALTAAGDAVRTDPQSASNRRVNAQALWAAKRLKAAEMEFQQALVLGPTLLVTLATYARFLKATSRLREAQEIVHRAVLIQPDALEVMLLRGQIAFLFERLEEARDMAMWALSRNAMDREALKLLAMVKSRTSWLTSPFWLLANVMARHRRAAVLAILLIGGMMGAASEALFPDSDRTNVDAAAGDVMIVFVIYALACALHVSFLVRRDLRQVKLKRDF